MTVIKIFQNGEAVLRKTAKEVKLTDIGGKKIDGLIKKMFEALALCDDGVALAAPQIGESLRVFVVSEKVFSIDDDGNETEDASKKDRKKEHLVYINPVITKKSSKKAAMDEGCLSVRGIFGKIDRYEKATVAAYDEYGKKFTRGASGLLAEIYQHETDHLNGVLFIDTAKNLVRVEPKQDGKNIENRN